MKALQRGVAVEGIISDIVQILQIIKVDRFEILAIIEGICRDLLHSGDFVHFAVHDHALVKGDSFQIIALLKGMLRDFALTAPSVYIMGQTRVYIYTELL